MSFLASFAEISSVLRCDYYLLSRDIVEPFKSAQREQTSVVRGVCTDSREVRDGSLFVARRGENTDGHRFLSAAIQAGCLGVVVEKEWFDQIGSEELRTLGGLSPSRYVSMFVVSDSTRALGDLAQYWRKKLALPTVAITGSVGKTTAKECARAVLTHLLGRGRASEKSHNNHVGLPSTILSASEGDNWLLLEAGMNHSGELDYLGEISEPDLSVILNVEPVHLGNLGSLAGIARAKCELLLRTRAGGVALVNIDSVPLIEELSRLRREGHALPRIVYFGKKAEADYRLLEAQQRGERLHLLFSSGKEVASAEVPIIGEHHAYNALVAVSIAHLLRPELPLSALALSLGEYKGAPMRFEIKRLRIPSALALAGSTQQEAGTAEIELINDAYNANPSSMRASLATARNYAGASSCAAVLGDMRELGGESEFYHEQLGQDAAQSQLDYLICVGEYASLIADTARSLGLKQVFVAADCEHVADLIIKLGLPKVLLVKASRALGLEAVIAILEERIDALSSSLRTQ